jgi:methylmalonyl-CoA epimerase
VRISHIGIAVHNSAQAAQFFTTVLGCLDEGEEILKAMKLRVRRLKTGGIGLELLEPMEGEEVISSFLSKRGEGLHHICFDVNDIAYITEKIKGMGYTVLYEVAREGAEGKLVNFLLPRETYGVLIELRQ